MWEITIIKETDDGYLCMSPNGDTQWMTKEEYINHLKNRKCPETHTSNEKA